MNYYLSHLTVFEKVAYLSSNTINNDIGVQRGVQECLIRGAALKTAIKRICGLAICILLVPKFNPIVVKCLGCLSITIVVFDLAKTIYNTRKIVLRTLVNDLTFIFQNIIIYVDSERKHKEDRVITIFNKAHVVNDLESAKKRLTEIIGTYNFIKSDISNDSLTVLTKKILDIALDPEISSLTENWPLLQDSCRRYNYGIHANENEPFVELRVGEDGNYRAQLYAL